MLLNLKHSVLFLVFKKKLIRVVSLRSTAIKTPCVFAGFYSPILSDFIADLNQANIIW